MRTWISTLLFCYSLVTASQECIIISKSFNQTPVRDFLNELSKTQEITLYFKDEWIDSLSLNGTYDQVCVEDILSKELNDKGIFVTKLEGAIILTYQNPILSENDEYLSSNTVEDPNNEILDYIFNEELIRESSMTIVGSRTRINIKETPTISGIVRDDKNEPLPGVIIYKDDSPYSTVSNFEGKYTLAIPKGKHNILFRFTGMSERTEEVIVFSSGTLDVQLSEQILTLDELIVRSTSESIREAQMGIERMQLSNMKTSPKILGENDVIKATLALPGVSSAGEASMGFNVRGGSADQNLILLNQLPIYNSSHFFGFFSVFNEEIIGSSELYKSYTPAKFGGRLSSVLDVRTKDLDTDKFSGSGGISPITTRFSFSTPNIGKHVQASFGYRSTYSDWVLQSVENPQVQNSNISFDDFYASLNYTINSKNTITFFKYSSNDSFNLLSDSTISYSNSIVSAQLNSKLSERLSLNSIVGTSTYQYQIEHDEFAFEAVKIDFSVREFNFKNDFNYVVSQSQTLNFGIDFRSYEIEPGTQKPVNELSNIAFKKLPTENAIELSPYISESFELSSKINLNFGLRYSIFGFQNPKTYYKYGDGPKELFNIVDTLETTSQFAKVYHGPEWRFSVGYAISNISSVKLSINRNRQYMSMLSNSISIAPFDTWKLSDYHIQPQIADQVSLGFYRNIWRGKLESSIELYYKKSDGLLDYKVGSQLLMNENIETDVLQGEGKAYGVEFMLRKQAGKLTGWISYTLSRSFLRVDSRYTSETINNGEFFPSNFDKPHSLSIISNYKFTKRFSASINAQYLSGRPLTYPIGYYSVGGQTLIDYSERNQYRIDNYYRVDIGLNLEGNHKRNKLAHGFWSFSIYNLFGRNNPYSVFFVQEKDQIVAKQLSIFGNAVPSLSYNFKF